MACPLQALGKNLLLVQGTDAQRKLQRTRTKRAGKPLIFKWNWLATAAKEGIMRGIIT
jgi:hypothetical protein